MHVVVFTFFWFFSPLLSHLARKTSLSRYERYSCPESYVCTAFFDRGAHDKMNEHEFMTRILKTDKQLNRAVHKALFMNLRLKRWLTEEDLKQEVLMRLVRASRDVTVKDDAHFTNLMLLQLRRSLIDYHRKMFGPNGWAVNLKTDPKATKLNSASEENMARAMVAAGAPVTIDEWIDFHESVDTLPEDERQIFEFFFYGGMKDNEIAELIGCSDRTVRRHFKSARDKLQARIDLGRKKS